MVTQRLNSLSNLNRNVTVWFSEIEWSACLFFSHILNACLLVEYVPLTKVNLRVCCILVFHVDTYTPSKLVSHFSIGRERKIAVEK